MDFIYIYTEPTGYPDKIKVGIGRNGEANSYQTGNPYRDGKMIFRLLTNDPKRIESRVHNNPKYGFSNEWCDHVFLEDIKEDILEMHNAFNSNDNSDFDGYTLVNGWSIVDKLKPAKTQRKLTNNVNKVKKDIVEVGFLLKPIVITKDYEIVDGNHRFNAITQLAEETKVKYPMPLIMVDEITDEHFVAINTGHKNLAVKDYVKQHRLAGNPNYKELDEILNRRPGGISESALIKVYGKNSSGKYKDGEFEMGNHGDKAVDVIVRFKDIADFDVINRHVIAIADIVRDNPNLDVDLFIESAIGIENFALKTKFSTELCERYNNNFPPYDSNRIYV